MDGIGVTIQPLLVLGLGGAAGDQNDTQGRLYHPLLVLGLGGAAGEHLWLGVTG